MLQLRNVGLRRRVPVNYRPTCAVCGHTFEPDTDHVVVTAEEKRMRDRDETAEYYFHATCWRNVADGWEAP